MSTQYALPGLWVTEHTLDVPLDWAHPDGESIQVFVRELVRPDRRHDDLPLLTYLQGGPGGANPRPLSAGGWIEEALKHYRLVLVDQRGTGRSTPLDGVEVAARDAAGTGSAPVDRATADGGTRPGTGVGGVTARGGGAGRVTAGIGTTGGDRARPGEAGADFLACFRADSIVRDLEAVRMRLYGGAKWATLAQSYGGWLTLTYLSLAPEALAACYICGGVPGTPPSAEEVYRRTFGRVADKSAEYYRRYPQDAAIVGAVADVIANGTTRLPDGDLLTVHRLQTLGQDFGFKPGYERMHWLMEQAFIRPGRLSDAFLEAVLTRTSSASNPLFWILQETIYGSGSNGPTAWAASRERAQRAEFGEDRRPLLFTGEMAFPWMFQEVRLLKPMAEVAEALARRETWPELYDLEALENNEVPVAAAVYFEDMFVDSGLQRDTLAHVGNSQAWVTNEFEHDGINSGRTFTRLRELVLDRGGENR